MSMVITCLLCTILATLVGLEEEVKFNLLPLHWRNCCNEGVFDNTYVHFGKLSQFTKVLSGKKRRDLVRGVLFHMYDHGYMVPLAILSVPTWELASLHHWKCFNLEGSRNICPN